MLAATFVGLPAASTFVELQSAPYKPISKAVVCTFQQLLLLFLFFATLTLSPKPSHARWANSEQAPLHIVRNIQTITVTKTGTWSLHGFLELRVGNEAGRSLLSPFRMPIREDLDEIRIQSAEIANGATTKIIPSNQFKTRQTVRNSLRPFASQKVIEIDFGNVANGATARIEYEVFNQTSRLGDLFSMTFIWGQEYPELQSEIAVEAFTPLSFDISKAASQLVAFKEGRSKDGQRLRWEFSLKAPVFRRLENELGSLATTELIPRVQISNKKSWSAIATPLSMTFEKQLSSPLPPEIQKIASESSIGRLEDRVNGALEKIRSIVSRRSEWSAEENSLGLRSLQDIIKRRSADPKEFALITVAVLRAMGLKAQPALAWREPQTERLIIEERPKAPGLQIFNHVLVRWGADRPRYFDPFLSISFADGYLTDVGGSWALPLVAENAELEYLPLNDPSPSNIKFHQQLEPRTDFSAKIEGTINITGPLAAELKELYHSAGAARSEPYLRQLLGIGLQSASQPSIRIKNIDASGAELDISFSSIQDGALRLAGAIRYVTFPIPGLLSSPLFATPERVSNVGLIRNLSVDIETHILGAPIADESSSSCLALNRFTSIVRETTSTAQMAIVKDKVHFKSGRITTEEMNNETFKKELSFYTTCLNRTSVTFGSRDKFNDPKWNLDESTRRILSKAPNTISLAEIHSLGQLGPSALSQTIQTKIWLALRSYLRQAPTSPSPSHLILLEYAMSLLQLGQLEDGAYLPEHIAEAAKIFNDISKPLASKADLHRLHFLLLFGTARYQDALIAIKNSITLEADALQDQVYLGMLYEKLGKTVLAETTLEAALTSKGPALWKSRAHQTLANIRLGQNKIAEFERLLESAIRLEPQNPWLKYSYARQLFQVKNLDKTITQCKGAIALMPFPLAETLLTTALTTKALRLYSIDGTIAGAPTTNPTNLEQAERLALDAIRYSSQNGIALRIVGHAAFEKALKGDYGSLIAAQNYLSKASELLVNDAWTKERLFFANQALRTRKSLLSLWNARVPAASAAKPAATIPAGTAPAGPAPLAPKAN